MAKTFGFRGCWFMSKPASLPCLGLLCWMTASLLPPLNGDEPARRSDPPTFTKDVAPILQKKCQNCHRRDHVGPFSLETYEQARKRAADIAAGGRRPDDAPLEAGPGIRAEAQA